MVVSWDILFVANLSLMYMWPFVGSCRRPIYILAMFPHRLELHTVAHSCHYLSSILFSLFRCYEMIVCWSCACMITLNVVRLMRAWNLVGWCGNCASYRIISAHYYNACSLLGISQLQLLKYQHLQIIFMPKVWIFVIHYPYTRYRYIMVDSRTVAWATSHVVISDMINVVPVRQVTAQSVPLNQICNPI